MYLVGFYNEFYSSRSLVSSSGLGSFVTTHNQLIANNKRFFN